MGKTSAAVKRVKKKDATTTAAEKKPHKKTQKKTKPKTKPQTNPKPKTKPKKKKPHPRNATERIGNRIKLKINGPKKLAETALAPQVIMPNQGSLSLSLPQDASGLTPRFSVVHGCYLLGDIKLHGVYSYLKQHFFHDIPLVKNTKLKMPAPIAKLQSLLFSSGRDDTTGRVRGAMVGRELAAIAENKRSARDPELHRYTVAALAQFAILGWTLVKGEFPVGHLGYRLGTGVDCIVYDERTRTHRAIEIKTGMHSNFETVYGKMRGDLKYVDNSALNQALLQLGVTHALLRLHWPIYAAGTPAVVHLCDNGTNVHYLDKDRFATEINIVLHHRLLSVQ